MNDGNLDLNARMAHLLGWKNVVRHNLAKSGIAGYSPNGQFAPVPDWVADWSELMPLACEHLVDLQHSETGVCAEWGAGQFVERDIPDEPDGSRDIEVRRVLVLALIDKLGSQNG